MKIGPRMIMAIFLVCLLGACGKKEEDVNPSVLIAVSSTQTVAPAQQPAPTLAVSSTQTVAPAQQPAPTLAVSSPTVSATTGMISGRVYLTTPPTPHMTVYALDVKSGRWASTETIPVDYKAPFSLIVPPGSYQIFGFTDDNGIVGYSADGSALTMITVAANQTVVDVILAPPGQFECGSKYGVPAAPDDRFKAVPGPSASCMATIKASKNPAPPAAQPQRIQFKSDGTSTRIQDVIPAAGRHYVFFAMPGDEMTVNLTSTGSPASSPAYFVLTASDGTKLAKVDQRLTQWTGILSTSQLYYIDLATVDQIPVDCTLDIAIKPIHSDVQNSNIRLKVIPDGFEDIASLSQNVMLPAQFPRTGGLPEVVPYLLWAENGDYDVSLDYGEDCRAAEDCHYGSLSGMKIYSANLQDTPNFTFEEERAKIVYLANGIQGYYIEGQCGASCADSRLFWLYNGYQYMIGLKGAMENNVISHAVAVIENSLP